MDKGDTSNLRVDTKPSPEKDKAKQPALPHEKANLTSYSFVRNNEEPNSANSPSSPPPLKENPAQSNFMHINPQLTQMPQPGYGQMPPQMMMNFAAPSPQYPPMYGQPMKGPEPILTSTSPSDPRIVFHDMQFMHDNSANNTPCSQVDPSPTAETLIPGFLKDEIDNSENVPKTGAVSEQQTTSDQAKPYTFPSKKVDDSPQQGKFWAFWYLKTN